MSMKTEQDSREPRNLQEELGKKNPFDRPEDEAYLNLMRSADYLSGQVRTLLAEYGLSEPLYNVLRIVAARGKTGIPSQSIAHDMVCRSPDMTALVDRLCKAGLVDRTRSQEDRRVIIVHVTPQGSELLKHVHKPLGQLCQQMLGHLSPQQLGTLSKLLFKARHPQDQP